MIPKIIHQIWVGDFKIPIRETHLIEQIKEMHPTYEHMMWVEAPPLPAAMQTWYDKLYAIKNYAFCADLLRMWVVEQYGGFYLDVDFKPISPLDPFLQRDGLFCYHSDDDLTIPNGVFAASKGHPILQCCIASINEENGWFGPSWFGETIKACMGINNDTLQEQVKQRMYEQNIEYLPYTTFETEYARHLSLYSWSPEVWTRLNNNEQL